MAKKDSLSEGVWRRAWRDTVHAAKSFKFAVALTASNVVVVLATYSTLSDPSTSWQRRYVVLAMSVGGALICLTIITFLAIWVVTPFRQRDEARSHLKRLTAGPKISIYCDESRTYVMETIVDVYANPSGLFIHVMVKNDSSTVALGCKARLINCEVKVDGKFQPDNLFRSPIPLF